VAAVRQALLDHLVIFFRDQDLPPGRFLALARRFGTPIEYPFVKGIEGYPQGNRVKECVTNGESAESMRSLDSVDGGHPWTMRHRAWTRLSRPRLF